MIEGRCLCGGVRFTVERFVGPFELCHCPRCRKASGSAFVSGVGVRAEDFRWVAGRELVRTWQAPVREAPPPYGVAFCERCGSPAPNPPEDGGWFEIPAGLLETDPGVGPDRHIYVECKSEWFEIADGLPCLTADEIRAHRAGKRREDA